MSIRHFLSLLLYLACPAYSGVLDDYVKKPEPAYEWRSVKQYTNPSSFLNFCGSCSVSVISLNSLDWRSKEEVNRTLWHHWLILAIPETPHPSTVLLMVESGDNRRKKPPDNLDRVQAYLAESLEMVVAQIKMVPNQPLAFRDETNPIHKEKGRKEDQLIAYSWKKYLSTGDSEWLIRLPMTKSVVSGMNAVTEFLAQESNSFPALNIENFILIGGSKRGWTSWLAAAVDERVKGLVPLSADMLNIQESFRHHKHVYGFYSPAISDFVDMGLLGNQQVSGYDMMSENNYQELLKIVDPYFYMNRLTMPKYIVNGASDEFFLPDSSQFYFKDLLPQKYLRYVPNAGHSLGVNKPSLTNMDNNLGLYQAVTDVVPGIRAFIQMVAYDEKLPEFSWRFEKPNQVVLDVSDPPRKVRLWQADNEQSRDFRYSSIGRAWESKSIDYDGGPSVSVDVEVPEKGWRAYMVELTYGSTYGEVRFSTEVKVISSR